MAETISFQLTKTEICSFFYICIVLHKQFLISMSQTILLPETKNYPKELFVFRARYYRRIMLYIDVKKYFREKSQIGLK